MTDGGQAQKESTDTTLGQARARRGAGAVWLVPAQRVTGADLEPEVAHPAGRPPWPDRVPRVAGPAPESGRPVSLLIVGRPTLFRDGLHEVLEAEAGIAVVGVAGTPHTALTLASNAPPQVVLLDIELLGGHPGQLIRQLRARTPRSRVIVLSTNEDPQMVQELLTLGISAYLPKTVTRQELLSAVCGTDDGRITLSLSRLGLEQISRTAVGPLSGRERDVLALAAEALTNAQIASRLTITEGTVKRHLRNIFAKLGAVSRIDAVNKAIAASVIAAPRAWTSPPS